MAQFLECLDINKNLVLMNTDQIMSIRKTDDHGFEGKYRLTFINTEAYYYISEAVYEQLYLGTDVPVITEKTRGFSKAEIQKNVSDNIQKKYDRILGDNKITVS